MVSVLGSMGSDLSVVEVSSSSTSVHHWSQSTACSHLHHVSERVDDSQALD